MGISYKELKMYTLRQNLRPWINAKTVSFWQFWRYVFMGKNDEKP